MRPIREDQREDTGMSGRESLYEREAPVSQGLRLLDLFCGAGGAAMGYQRAGFYVVGVDIKPQPRYCGDEFVQADALDVLRHIGFGHWESNFAAIHASPPCQAYSSLRHRTKGEYPDLIAAVRELLIATELPYVIENVEGAPLLDPVTICGSSLALGANGRQLRRHRLFESNVALMVPPCSHSGQAVGVYGNGGGGQMNRGYKAAGVVEARAALGTPWMSLKECSQAIPPAYTELIGHQLIAHVTSEVAA